MGKKAQNKITKYKIKIKLIIQYVKNCSSNSKA